MKIEEQVRELILESRGIKFSDVSETSDLGTFGRVSPELREWYNKCEQLILKEADVYSSTWEKFESIELDIVQGNYKDKFDLLKATVVSALKELVVKPRVIQETKKEKVKSNNSDKDVFIVHGHEEGIKNKVARFVESIGYNPIILHEQASTGNTIIEKIEAYSSVHFGIVLYTGCDQGKKAKEEDVLKKRARQNVVFEHGYLIANIGRNNVCALVESEVEIPNDISGVVYVELDKNDAWKFTIAKEMKASGLEIDMNKIK